MERHQQLVLQTKLRIYKELPMLYKIFDYVTTIIPDEKVPTLGVSRGTDQFYTLRYNPQFLLSISEKESKALVGIFAHELLHIALGHFLSFRIPKDIVLNADNRTVTPASVPYMKLWNMATDLAINPLIKDYLGDVPFKRFGIFPSDYGFEDGASAEGYYDALKEKQQQDPERQLSEFDVPTVAHNEAIPGGEAAGNIEQQTVDADIAEVGYQAMQQVAAAAKESGTAGSVSLLSRATSKVPQWFAKLKSLVATSYVPKRTATRKRYNKRFGFPLPSTKTEYQSYKYLVAIDTSSSISMEMYDQFAKALKYIRHLADIDVVTFNEALRNTTPTPIRDFNIRDVAINGGTEFDPVVTLWNTVHNKYSSLVIFTDGESSLNVSPTRKKDIHWLLYGDPSEEHRELIGNKIKMNMQ